MLDHYSDHAANERTFLAWIRTAIAVMAFGFLVEKFDIFLEMASRTLAGAVPAPVGHRVGDVAGLLLILLGGVMMALALVRFRRTEVAIDDPVRHRSGGGAIDAALVLLLTLLALALFAYLLYTVARQM